MKPYTQTQITDKIESWFLHYEKIHNFLSVIAKLLLSQNRKQMHLRHSSNDSANEIEFSAK